jgi:signal transduction histidine kinase
MTTGARDAAAAALDARPDMGSARVLRESDLGEVEGALLDLLASLPVEAEPTAVVAGVLDVLAAAFQGRSLGVVLVLPESDTPQIELRLPPGMARPRTDPIRLFPDLDEEWVLGLAELAGSTLHVASAGAPLGPGTPRVIAERAAALLSARVRTALAVRGGRPESRQIADLRAQLVQAEKLATLGQIVAGVVHELANPVTSIVACTDFLLRRPPAAGAPPDDLEHLKRISVAAERILKFSRDLVSYSRPAREEVGPVALHEVILQAQVFSQHEFERQGIQFATDYAAGAPALLGQSGPLTQVFVNLFVNAAHAMSDHGGRLSVRTRLDPAGGLLYVDVTDTGIGIPEATLPRIFEPFFTTKDAGQGTGLGLSIVKEIVDAHGGTLHAASTPGEGTTFTVGLPLLRSGRP